MGLFLATYSPTPAHLPHGNPVSVYVFYLSVLSCLFLFVSFFFAAVVSSMLFVLIVGCKADINRSKQCKYQGLY